MQATVRLSFHCNASKSAFIARNQIKPEEVLAESPASITLADTGEKWENSCFVFSVAR